MVNPDIKVLRRLLPEYGSASAVAERQRRRYTPPKDLRDNQHILPAHVIPELSVLLGVRKGGQNVARPLVSGNLEIDKCSSDVKRIIETGLFSHDFDPSYVPVWTVDAGKIKPTNQPTEQGLNDAFKELRDVSIGVILGITLNYQRAKDAHIPFTIGSVGGEVLTISQNHTEERGPLTEKRNARRELLQAIDQEYRSFASDFNTITKILHNLPDNHPLYWMSVNFSKLTALGVGSHKDPVGFIMNGLDTFKQVTTATALFISDFSQRLTAGQQVDAFGASLDIARTLSGLNIDLFAYLRTELFESDGSSKLRRLLHLPDRFRPEYFELFSGGKDAEKPTTLLVFSKAGHALLERGKKLFEESVAKRPEISNTIHCPARRGGDDRLDDIIITLHERIARKAREHVTGKAA